MKSSFVSGGNNKLILHKSARDCLWKAFFQLDFITSTAVICKKPDFPSCCLQTIAFWWEQVQFPLAPILFLKQTPFEQSIKAFHWEYRHSLSYVWAFLQSESENSSSFTDRDSEDKKKEPVYLLAFLTSSLAFSFLLLMGTLCGRTGYFREQTICSFNPLLSGPESKQNFPTPKLAPQRAWKLYQVSSLRLMC